MKKINLPLLVLFLGGFTVEANVIVGSDGQNYIVSEWSSPESILLQTAAGQIEAQRQSISVDRPNSPFLDRYKIVLVSSKTLDNALLAPECENYVVVAAKIAGLHSIGDLLVLKLANINGRGDVGASLENNLKNVLEHERETFHSAEDTFPYRLTTVFGYDCFAPKGSSTLGDPFSIKATSFEGANLIVDVESAIKLSLQVTIDPSGNLISASKNGVKIKLLRTGRIPSPVPAWSWPSEYSILGPSGKSLIPGCSRAVELTSAEGKVSVLGIKALWASEDRFWVGPSLCKIAFLGDGIIGVETDDDAQLLIYKTTVKVHSGDDGAGFERQLQNVDGAIGAGVVVPEPKALKISELFPDLLVAQGPDLRVFSLSYSAGDLEISLDTNDPKIRLIISLSVDLSVVSSRAIDVDPNIIEF